MTVGGNVASYERGVLNDKALSRGARACSYELFSMTRGRPFSGVQVSQANLAARLGVSVRTVRRYLRELRLAGVLEAMFQRVKVCGVWVRTMSRYRFIPRACRVLMRARAAMQSAAHSLKAVQDRIVRGVASRNLNGEPNGSLSSFDRLRRELSTRYSGEEMALFDALPSGGGNGGVFGRKL